MKIEDLENLTKLTDEEASQINGRGPSYQRGGTITPQNAVRVGGVVAAGVVGWVIGTVIYDAYGTEIVDGIEWLLN